MWLGSSVALTLAIFALVWNWRVLRRPTGLVSGLLFGLGPWPALAASVAMPLALQGVWLPVRIAVSVFAITTATKAWVTAHGGPRDPAMASGLGRFTLWFVMPPESTWPRDAAAFAMARARGLRRGARGVAKSLGFAALFGVHLQFPALHDSRFVEAFWALWLCWLGISAIVDLVTCVPMLAGVEVEEIFDAPPLARSPRDFWGRRWNLFVHRFVARFLFRPLGGRRHPALATLGVFVCSGLMHEYFVLAALGGTGHHTGWMMGFFVIQGAGVVVEMRGRRRRTGLPRGLAIGLHTAWMTLTSPLFFGPLGEMFEGW